MVRCSGELCWFLRFSWQRSLATDLQKLSMELRKKQSTYLNRLRQQKEVQSKFSISTIPWAQILTFNSKANWQFKSGATHGLIYLRTWKCAASCILHTELNCMIWCFYFLLIISGTNLISFSSLQAYWISSRAYLLNFSLLLMFYVGARWGWFRDESEWK